MTELIRNAWLGWQEYTEPGKLAALLLVSLIYLWFAGNGREQRRLYSYAALMTVINIVPFTAAVLMLYQTRFYDYIWVWGLVPVTAVIAWAFTECVSRCWNEFQPSSWKRGLPVTALLLAAVVLSGSLGKLPFDRDQDERAHAREVLEELSGRQDGTICLWAPREIMEYARELDGSVQLVYGRNMWDASLNAYAYDTYPQELRDAYLWMELTDASGEAKADMGEERGTVILNGADSLETALRAGANCILLPSKLESSVAAELAETVGGNVSTIEGYFLLIKRG